MRSLRTVPLKFFPCPLLSTKPLAIVTVVSQKPSTGPGDDLSSYSNALVRRLSQLRVSFILEALPPSPPCPSFAPISEHGRAARMTDLSSTKASGFLRVQEERGGLRSAFPVRNAVDVEVIDGDDDDDDEEKR